MWKVIGSAIAAGFVFIIWSLISVWKIIIKNKHEIRLIKLYSKLYGSNYKDTKEKFKERNGKDAIKRLNELLAENDKMVTDFKDDKLIQDNEKMDINEYDKDDI